MRIRTDWVTAFVIGLLFPAIESLHAQTVDARVSNLWDSKDNGGFSNWKLTVRNTGKYTVKVQYTVKNQKQGASTAPFMCLYAELKPGQTATDGGAIFTSYKTEPIVGGGIVGTSDTGARPGNGGQGSSRGSGSNATNGGGGGSSGGSNSTAAPLNGKPGVAVLAGVWKGTSPPDRWRSASTNTLQLDKSGHGTWTTEDVFQKGGFCVTEYQATVEFLSSTAINLKCGPPRIIRGNGDVLHSGWSGGFSYSGQRLEGLGKCGGALLTRQ